MSRKVLVLPGDYIGPEIMAEAVQVLETVNARFELGIELEHGLLGGAAIDAHGVPLPDETLARAREVDAILLGAVGGPKWDDPSAKTRPEAGLLKIRKELGLFANLRPIRLFDQLAFLSSSPEASSTWFAKHSTSSGATATCAQTIPLRLVSRATSARSRSGSPRNVRPPVLSRLSGLSMRWTASSFSPGTRSPDATGAANPKLCSKAA